jgi:formylmethanofuran dehydrogenase subunit E
MRTSKLIDCESCGEKTLVAKIIDKLGNAICPSSLMESP